MSVRSKPINEWDQMESTFLKCLREIELAYVHLPKILRIRVEKWVEKLAGTGNNPTWRKHRNAFARLLLNMVVTRNLSEPFNVLPPEGPLPPYPFRIKGPSKDLLGPHETTFWRHMYERLQDSPKENQHIGQSLESVINSSSGHLSNFVKHVTNFDNREMTNLNLLIREQHERIQLLEQQLHEERVKHELMVQRMHYTHRVELNRLLDENSSRIFNSNGRHFNPKHEAIREFNYIGNNNRGNNLSSNRTITPQRSHSPSLLHESRPNIHFKDNSSVIERYCESGDAIDQYVRMTTVEPFIHARAPYNEEELVQDIPPSKFGGEGAAGAFQLLENKQSTLLVGKVRVNNEEKFQIVERMGTSPVNNLELNEAYDIMPVSKNDFQSTSAKFNQYSESAAVLSSNTGLSLELSDDRPSYEVPDGILAKSTEKTQDNDFFHYLEQFQNELRKVNMANVLDEGTLMSEDSLHE